MRIKISLRGKFIFLFTTILLIFGCVVYTTAHIEVRKLSQQSIGDKLNSDMNLGLSLINQKYDGQWNVKDNKLYKGDKPISGDYSVVDEVTKQTKSFSSIFLGDTRVSTSVLNEDGSRAINTKASENVTKVVLNEGKEYKGELKIFNKMYEAKYSPIKDSSGKVIGMWFVGSDKSEMDKQINKIDIIISTCIVFTLIIGIIILVVFTYPILINIRKIQEALKSVTSGNFNLKVNVKSKDEIGDIANTVNNMTEGLGNLIKEVKHMSLTVASSTKQMGSSSEEIRLVSDQVAKAINEVAQGATEQALSTDKGNKMILAIVSGLNEIASNMNNSDELAKKAKEKVSVGEKSVHYQESKMQEYRQVSSNVAKAIDKLSCKSNEIKDIIGAINDIAEQTNLLALNAAIEAARAGEQGRGFAVVSDEVRKLSEQSSLSVKKISDIIKEVITDVDQAVNEMNTAELVIDNQTKALSDTVNAFDDISSIVFSINEEINKVTIASTNLYKNAQDASAVIGDIANISEETAAGTEEVAASSAEQANTVLQIEEAAKNLSELANSLQSNLHKFNI